MDSVAISWDFTTRLKQIRATMCLREYNNAKSSSRECTGHKPYDPKGKGNSLEVVTVLRDPYERIVSGYLARFHSCPPMIQKTRVKAKKRGKGSAEQKGFGGAAYFDRNMKMSNAKFNEFARKNYKEGPASIEQYAKCVKGCQTNMLSGNNCGPGAGRGRGRKPKVVKALETLEKNVAFVGITERWNDTLLAWTSFFNTSMEDLVSVHARPSLARDPKDQTVSLPQEILKHLKLSGFKDHDDEVVHARANKMLDDQLEGMRMEAWRS
mmetsp:Transcript_10751/g.21531  ORF Transcript_10751/g.21531 Transcript_10751/m.21531 type:complete len:267 (-) Transcript_10751:28-828(-)